MHVDAFDENGKPRHRRGVSSEPGVYFLGLPWLSRRGSSFIWGVWHDAKYVADHITTQRGYLAYRTSREPVPAATEPAQSFSTWVLQRRENRARIRSRIMRCRVRVITAARRGARRRERALMAGATALAWTVIGWAAAAGADYGRQLLRKEECR